MILVCLNSYDDDEGDDQGGFNRKDLHNHRSSAKDLSDDEDYVPSRQPRQSRPQPKECPPRRTFDEDSEEEDEYRPHKGPSSHPQENDDDDDSYERHSYDRKEYFDRDRQRPSQRDKGRRKSRNPDDEDESYEHEGDSNYDRGNPGRGMSGRGSREGDNPMERRQSLRAGYWSPERRSDAPAERAPADPVFVPAPLNLNNMRSFLTSPIPKSAGVVQCYIRRYKPATSLYPTYNLYLKVP